MKDQFSSQLRNHNPEVVFWECQLENSTHRPETILKINTRNKMLDRALHRFCLLQMSSD